MTDPLRICANGLGTVRTCDLLDFLKGYCASEDVGGIVVGLPTTMRGEPSESQQWLVPAMKRLKKAMPEMPIIYYDERFTSVLAHRAMIDGGMKKQDRRGKEVVDKIAAAIILNDYLASIHGGGM